ncbi:glycerophosphodiester phosphodiesterase family protein [uncultured Pseudokineococcus sp.]|uniref:glycerophosphodiester phosphodiesterase family protein n=1 Tax=uncultured Pseudokineococcus sp. TaxID=1642928 RepID=UPI00261812F3|nr:glycerophosphodiester phosphodiesterase family protein [uncultured Pseudokineococcus sp.]
MTAGPPSAPVGAAGDGRPRPLALTGPRPLLLAHRGFSRDGLENTLAAFAAALELGADVLETDVHTTSDGVLVAFHDDRLDRTTDGEGELARTPWSVVSRARIGGREPVPRLAEVLEAFPDAVLNIDVKAPGAVRPLVALLRGTGAWERVVVASFSERRRRAVVRALPTGTATSAGAPLVAAVVAAVRAPVPATARRRAVARALAGVDVLQVPEDVATDAFVRAVHEAGRLVHVWTVDDVPTMHRLLDAGVDGLVTDRTDLLRRVLDARAAGRRGPVAPA